MRLAHETTMITGYHLMNCAQNCSFHLATMYVKHILLLVAWKKLLRLHSLSNSEIQRKQLQTFCRVLEKRSWAMVSDNEKVASRGKDATTCISESVQASSTVGLGIAGTICLNHVTAKEGQTCFNNDFG
jgi:hypothetical protein